ncbi:MAG: LamG domain-containing protein, partial [Myxococcales bacterium]|nr:LamG domain-containing protein [Myxococcales bacterium]
MLRAAQRLLPIGFLLLATTAADAALVGHWNLDEGVGITAGDVSGNGNDGTIVGDPAWIAGVDGDALAFDFDRVMVPDSAALDIAGPISITVWVRPDRKATQYLVKKARFGDFDGYEIALSSSGVPFVRFNQQSSGNRFKLNGATAYPVDGSTWMHLAAVFDGSEILLYLDGVLDATLAASGLVIGENDLDLSIGAQDTGSGRLRGALDGLRIFDHALDAVEIAAVMGGGGGGGGPTDTDGDGVIDSEDAFPNDPTEWSDVDGVGDNTDLEGDDSPDPAEPPAGTNPVAGDGDDEVARFEFSTASGATAVDTSGFANHASFTGSGGWGAGQSGSGLALDGSGARVLAPHAASLDLSNALTLSTWIRPEQRRTQYLVKKA